MVLLHVIFTLINWINWRVKAGCTISVLSSAVAFVYRVVCVGTQRQTNTQTQTRVLQGPACILPQPTFVRDQFKALRLPSPLPFPELHLQGEYSLSGEVDHSSDRRNRRCTQQNHCPSALLISSISPQSALHILSSRHIFTALSLNPCGKWYLCSALVPCVMPPLPSRHVNKLMTLIF